VFSGAKVTNLSGVAEVSAKNTWQILSGIYPSKAGAKFLKKRGARATVFKKVLWPQRGG
jgi:hypothetical protein